MKPKKITAWILFMAMLVTMLPISLVLAAGDTTTPTPYPIIVTDVFSEMTNDISGVDKGTDLDLTGTTNDSMPIVNTAAGAEVTLDGITGTVYHNKDSEINRMRRKQILTFVAKSQDGSNFINSSTSTGVAEKAVEIAYLDADRTPLEIKLDSENFEVIGSGDWSKAWIDLSQDVQQTDRTLESFLTHELDGINPKLLTAAQLFATGDMVSFMIYNVVRSDFTGYLRVKITDNNGNTTVQDYPIVADGQYPAVSISTSTYKNLVGANVESDPVTNVAENTFINEMDFVTVMEDTEENKAVNETDNIHKSYRWHSLDKAALQKALDWEDEEYKPEKIWAMGDISIDKIEISDLLVTSGIKSVKYSVANYGLKENVIPSTLEGTIELTYDPTTKLCSPATPIVISGEGFNVLAITAIDNSDLKTTNRYYFYIDTTAPKAKFNLVELDKNVVSLFTVADVVTNRQQAIDMSASDDVTASVDVISGLEDATRLEKLEDDRAINAMYQYRLLATKEGATEGGNVPDGYTSTVLDKEGNDLSGWKAWTGNTELPVIDKEFDGIIQVRVQDRAGNWSPIVSATSNGKETIITDNTNPVIDVKEYALNTNSDTTGNTVDEIINGTATDILVHSGVTEKTVGTITNEVIHTTTGDAAPWINDSAVLEVKITDADLANEIRSSGLNKGQINVKAEFNAENENKKIKIWNKNGVDKKNVDNSFNLTEDYIFGTETDKDLTFYIEYEGTGVVDITVSVKDQADVNDGDAFSSIYKTQLRVDKINPYIIYKGYDITDDAEKDLLRANNEKVDYEVRNMPWGPNSQVLEVVVKDDDITSVQSKTKNVKFNADKALDLYKVDGDAFTKVKTYAAGSNNVVALGDCEELANEKYESNVGYKFYLVYEGTGIAKVEFYADDSAKEPNVRDYPSVVTAADAEPVLYDAMLRVDKINPEIKNAKLVETDADVEDKGWSLFSFNETDADVNTRKQMKITFEIVDETTTTEQSGVNIQSEKISGVDLIDVYDKYVEKDKTHLYENKPTSYTTDNVNDQAVDPNIDYILLPVEAGSINGTGGKFEKAASASNEDIEALVAKYLDKEYNADGDKCEWKKASWKDGGIVVPDEFQGTIVLRTIDRVGNIDYSEPITFVAESREALIDFEPQNGYIWSQNNYGWSKRDYDYVEIRVKDDNEEKVDAWLENVFISVTDLEGNDISTKDTVKFAHKIHADDASLEVDPSAYTYVSLSDFTNEAAYGYDVIDNDGLVEKLARDEEGYIHLGYVRVAESAQIKVTVFDKAKVNNVEYTGNKTTGIWTSRIDRVAPVVTAFDLVPVYESAAPEDNNNGFALKIEAEDALSGMAPAITDVNNYNVYTPENIPTTGMFATDASYLYRITNDSDVEIDRYDGGPFNAGQYEMPGLQYALIPENGDLEDVMPWDFETDPDTIYDENGYNGKMGATNVWHNYVDDKTPTVPADFDGLIVVRAIDKAGNITVAGYSSILDVEADDDWNDETQYIQVRTDNKWSDGSVVDVQYYGNNNLLFPADMRKDLSNSLNNGEGAIIEIAEEGITNVVITATEKFTTAKTAKAKNNQRNSDWEGNMIIGNATATGYNDWKFQIVDVKIDKTNPEFGFELIDETGNAITDNAVEGSVTIKLTDIVDPIPNIPDELGYRSHIPSDIAKVEWCAIPEGSDEEAWKDATDWKNNEVGTFDADAFTGTIKVRVTDNAGNVTVKTQRINVDGVEALISIEAPIEWQKSSVLVPVTVTENAEFSDVVKVAYTLNGGAEKALTLNGGTILVSGEGITKIVVIATTKAGVTKTAEATVKIDSIAPEYVIAKPANGEAVQGNVPVVIKDMTEKTSGVKAVEWCAVPEGSSEEKWKPAAAEAWTTGDVGTVEVETGKAFKGTVKVRVTDNAGHVTIKTQIVNIDKSEPIISISKSYDEKCSHEPVDVFVTVSESAEFSDITSVTYEVKNGNTVKTGILPLIGGTITVDFEDETNVKVTATNKAGKSKTEETTVSIHYSDITIPKIKGTVANSTEQKELKSGDWVVGNTLNVDYADAEEYPVWYSLNGGNWTKVDNETTTDVETAIKSLEPGANTIRIQSRSKRCLCKSDVVTYIINYDNKVAPKVDIKHDFAIKEKDVDIFGKAFKVVNVSNTTRMVSIVPSKGESVADIVAVKYDLLHSDGSATKKDMYSPIAGSMLAITDEGTWHIANIRVTTASGLEYVKLNDGSFEVNTEEIQSQYESYDLNGACPVYLETVAKIDKTGPKIDETELTKVLDSDGKEIELFGLSNITSKQKGLKVKATDAMITSDDKGRALLKYEYALLEKGASVPNWKQIGVGYGWSGDVVESGDPIITTDFEGEVLVKVTDIAGNSTIKSISVVADANSPEISVTAPSDWQTENFMVQVDVNDKGLSSEIKRVNYKLYDGVLSDTVVEEKIKAETSFTKAETLASIGGSIEVTKEGEHTIGIIAEDYAGNVETSAIIVKLDKTAPEYSRMIQLLGVYNEHEIPESEWNIIHDGWTYNHDVSLDGIKDIHSGIKKVNIKFTSEDGSTTETTLNSHQTSSSFSESGKYDLILIDNAGNVRNISFAIDKELQNVINVIGVDEVGKLNIAVTDGDDMLTFYKKENSESKYTKMYNGITDQLVDGKTGVRYIYGQNDSGKKSNTLYVIVAPSTEYGISLMSLNLTPNRYLNIDAEGGSVTVKKIDEIFNPGINKNISVGSVVEINEDGVYSITTND